MAVWKCSVCSTVKESRCRPQKCPNCGAVKEEIVKDEKK